MERTADPAGPVVVAVLTYRRPEVLTRLLPELARQARLLGAGTRVLVVDNDPDASARPAVERLAIPEAEYVHEPRPGIAAGRNAALEAATGADVLVFIDDDETPDEDWLATMVAAHRRLRGAAVVGPVLRIHETEPAAWVRWARVFDRRRMATGTPMEAAGSGNLLLDLAHVRRHGLRFADALGLSGGSDHLFTKELRRAGGAIYWCDEAVVREHVPASRLTGRWTMRRGYRSGGTSVLVDLMLARTRREELSVRARALVAGAARVVVGAARALLGVVTRNPEHHGRGAWTLARGAGILGGAVGHTVVEYRRP
ncbi:MULTISPECIES: glycosyltransferase family 2 protein [unclassified Actinotalea]|uniref:glycosyltransferase family 2 protein n=1 Tax=unclassified Actinotalea TaxID=2638618 RepID=UPI0015F4473E|nr:MULTISPECIES: glycosyltransferase family 2 protein [unclassified Actinotalea]